MIFEDDQYMKSVASAWHLYFNSTLRSTYLTIEQEVGTKQAQSFVAINMRAFYNGAISMFYMLEDGVDEAILSDELTEYCSRVHDEAHGIKPSRNPRNLC